MIWLFSLAVAAPPVVERDSDTQHAFRADNIDRYDVLDVSDTHVALKVIHHRAADEMEGFEPKKCEYAGMSEYSTSGVALILFELGEHDPEVFTVYEAVLDPEPCMDHVTSKANLEKAKARFAEVGLDIAKKPAPLEGNVLKRDGRSISVKATDATTNDGVMTGTLTWTVHVGDEPVYRSAKSYTMAMAGTASMKPLKTWATPSGVVGLEHTLFFSGRGGNLNTLGFTPLLPLPDKP